MHERPSEPVDAVSRRVPPSIGIRLALALLAVGFLAGLTVPYEGMTPSSAATSAPTSSPGAPAQRADPAPVPASDSPSERVAPADEPPAAGNRRDRARPPRRPIAPPGAFVV